MHAMLPENTPPPAPPVATPPPATDTREAKLKVYDRLLATVSLLSVIAGGAWGVYTYSETRRKETEQKESQAKREGEQKEADARQRAAEAKREADLREKEIQLRKHELDLIIFKERKEAYQSLCDAACEVVACRDRKEVEERSRTFFKLYYGRAHIIAEADPNVSDKKIAFKGRLVEYLEGAAKDSTESPFTFFAVAAFDLTKACSKHLDPRSLLAVPP